jgi:hypothetical protein
MICKICGNDKHDVMNVFRNRNRKEGKWIVSEDHDTRIVICTACGKRVFTITSWGGDITFNKENMKRYEKDSDGKLYLFEDNNE